MNIVIMGAQGSGKGTQARLLAKEYGLDYFETGDLLRKIAKEDSDLGRTIDDLINKKGQFVPWKNFRQILNAEADKMDFDKGIIFDGTPRRMEEVFFWEEKLEDLGRDFDLIFYINLDKEESLKRIASRIMCKNKHNLILGKNVQSEDDLCPICGKEIEKREDDSMEKVLKRLEWNAEILGPVIEHYRKEGTLIEIDGKRGVDKVYKDIKSYIDKAK